MNDQAARDGSLRHVAWLYRTHGEYLAGLREFVQAGLAAREPVLVVLASGRLPPGWNLQAWNGDAVILDAADLGQNPSRVMPVVRAFADEHPGQRVRVASELTWPGRSAAELGEVSRYETAVNLAFAATPVSMLCPYDAARLPASAISGACASHPWLRQGGREAQSSEYPGPPDGRPVPRQPLRVPPGAKALTYRADLRPVRALVAAEAGQAGLPQARRTDLVIAASEVAANTLKHTSGPGLVRVWVTDDEVLCQFEDTGHIDDPLAGYCRPLRDVPGGQGLWLVNQVCDLSEISSSVAGTTIRLHMYRGVPSLRQPAGARAGHDRSN